ncbi:hypothetical protein QT972_15805 [Microcoleus sp. herbarium7]|uniref:hypothetical protein n=1 Tax=Microcoleus sp. herbarium7 TaxID=3055435 RepID=UPI002FD3CE89
MPYESAYEVLKRCTSTIPECVDAIEELAIEYGYITATVAIGTRRNADADLIRIRVLSAALKYRINELSQSH